jgi:hypothetical protein
MKPRHINCNFVNFDDGTCWPRMYPCGDHETNVAWRLRYRPCSHLPKTVDDGLVAASFMDAYTALLDKPMRIRNQIVAALRKVEKDINEGRETCRQCHPVPKVPPAVATGNGGATGADVLEVPATAAAAPDETER